MVQLNASTSDILTMALYEQSRHLPKSPIPSQAFGMGNNKTNNGMVLYGVIVFYFSILIMSRLDQEKVTELQPTRMRYAIEQLIKKGFTIEYENSSRVEFIYKGSKVVLFPYSGWHTGTTIMDGRGINNLLKQLV